MNSYIVELIGKNKEVVEGILEVLDHWAVFANETGVILKVFPREQIYEIRKQ